MSESPALSFRKATLADLPELRSLMEISIRKIIGSFLDAARVEASYEFMGVDTQLIEDGTYFAVELNRQVDRQGDRQIVGCGGWSRRATRFGGDHTPGRDSRLLDPLTEPARVRAMYTHPDFTRLGIGRLVLSLCEAEASKEGFAALELTATIAGEPLYSAYGFTVIERIEVPTSKGITVPCARMTRHIATAAIV